VNVQVFYTGDSWSLQHTYYIPSNGTWNASSPNVVARELMPGSPVSAFVFNATNSSSQVAVFYVAANSTIQGITGQVGNSTSYYRGVADQWTTHPVSSLNLTVSYSMFILACPPDSANSNSTLILYFASPGQGLRKLGWWATGSQWQSKELTDIPDLAPSAQVACQTFDTGDVLWASNGQGQVEQWWRSANESNNTWTRGMFLINSTTIATTLSITNALLYSQAFQFPSTPWLTLAYALSPLRSRPGTTSSYKTTLPTSSATTSPAHSPTPQSPIAPSFTRLPCLALASQPYSHLPPHVTTTRCFTRTPGPQAPRSGTDRSTPSHATRIRVAVTCPAHLRGVSADLQGRQWARDSMALESRAAIMARGCRQVSLLEEEAEEAEEEVVVVVVAAEVKGRECEIFLPFNTAAYHTMQLTVPSPNRTSRLVARSAVSCSPGFVFCCPCGCAQVVNSFESLLQIVESFYSRFQLCRQHITIISAPSTMPRLLQDFISNLHSRADSYYYYYYY